MTFEKFLVAWGKQWLNDGRNGRFAVPFSSRYRFPSPLQQRSPGHLGKIWACWHLPDLSQSSGKHWHLHVQPKFAFSLKQLINPYLSMPTQSIPHCSAPASQRPLRLGSDMPPPLLLLHCRQTQCHCGSEPLFDSAARNPPGPTCTS